MAHFQYRKGRVLMFASLLVLGLALSCGTADIPTSAPVATSTPLPSPRLAPGQAPASPTPTPLPVAVPTQGPKVSGRTVVDRLKVSIVPPNIQDTFPGRFVHSDGAHVYPMYQYLIYLDRPDNSAKPMLATKWEASNNFKTWRFNLREGITFHDGSPFTADDVAFTWEVLTAEKSVAVQVTFLRKLMGSVGAFEIVNDHEVVIKLTRPEVNLPYFLSSDMDYKVVSRKYWAKVGGEKGYVANPVGTGPYRFVKFQPGIGTSYTRVENHWWKTAPFPELEVRFAAEDLTRVAQLLAREVQMSVTPRSLNHQVRGGGMRIINSTLPGAQVAGFLGGQYLKDLDPGGPFTNKLVRQALNLAVDREQINSAIFGGLGELQALATFHPSITGDAYDPSWQVYPHDPERARKLLIEAGYSEVNPLRFKLMASPQPGAPEIPDVAEALVVMWQRIGARVDLEIAESGIVLNIFRDRKAQGIATIRRTSATQTFRLFGALYGSQALTGSVLQSYMHPWLEETWARYLNSTDLDERRKLLRSAGQHMYDEYATLPLVFLFTQVSVDPAVIAGYECNSLHWDMMRCLEFIDPVYR